MKLFTLRRRMLLLLAAALLFAAPNIVHAQFGALGNMAKGKALEALNDKVMKELEKKFTEVVAKEPISDAAKAATVKKLTEIARPIVKKFIDGAASGKPPNPMELVQTVLKDILPRVPEVIAATQTEGGAPVQGAYGQQGYAAGSVQQAQPIGEKPKLAVYVFGAEDPALNKAMASRLIASLSNSGRYQAARNYKEFFEQAIEEQEKSGASSIKTEQIKALGKQFGADYVCVAEITTALDEKQVSAHILSVETAEITATGASDVPLKTSADLTAAAEQIAEAMFKNAPPPPLVAAAPPPAPQYAEETNAEQAPAPERYDEETGAGQTAADADGGSETAPAFRTKNGFSLGYIYDGYATIFQAGFAQSRPIGEAGLSFVWEANVWGGYGERGYYDGYGDWDYDEYVVLGVNIPFLIQFDWSVLSFEGGVQLDALGKFGEYDGGKFNAGFVVGSGLSFGFARFFYRFNYGISYYSQMFCVRMMF